MYASYPGLSIPISVRGKTPPPILSTLDSGVPATPQLLGKIGKTHYKTSTTSTLVASSSWAHLTGTLQKCITFSFRLNSSGERWEKKWKMNFSPCIHRLNEISKFWICNNWHGSQESEWMPCSRAYGLFWELKGELDRRERLLDIFAELVRRPWMLSWNQILEIEFYRLLNLLSVLHTVF